MDGWMDGLTPTLAVFQLYRGVKTAMQFRPTIFYNICYRENSSEQNEQK
jgi:hypothetical protein